MSRRTLQQTALSLLAALAVAAPAGAQLPSSVSARARLLRSEIYDFAAWAKRLPYELAVPIIARAKLHAYVDDLDLPPEVRARIRARIDSRGFVDEIIPFLLAVRDVYQAPTADAPEDFDTWLRAHFSPADTIPGIEHSMFQWRPAAAQADAAFGVDPTLAAHLVEFYDALYLREAGAAAELDDQLACGRRDSDSARAPVAQRVAPIVRDLLTEIRGRLAGNTELAAAVDGILADQERVDTISISLVHFIDELVCRHYRIFATRVLREEQLRKWMLAELDKPGGGRLWEYLGEPRRFAALVVVDGLQGRLVETLTQPHDSSFLAAVRREYADTAASAPRTQQARPAPRQQVDFLDATAARGFAHDAYLPFFRRLFRQPAGIAEVGVSTTPTISVRNLPIAKTGAPVAGAGATGVPNFHFIDRDVAPGGRAYYFYGNDALQLVPLTRAAGMRTLFERLPELNSFSCAAQYDNAAHYSLDALLNLALGEKQRDFGEVRCFAALRRRAANERQLAKLRETLLATRANLSAALPWYRVLARSAQNDERALARNTIDHLAALEPESMPELLVYYNPWPDHFAHFKGPFSDEIISPSGELNRLDHWLGVLTGLYRDAGVADRTLFAMAGDHGLTPVFFLLNPEVEVFDRLRAEGVDFRVVKISSDEGEGPKLTNPLHPPSMKGYDAVVASTAGGNYMIDLFVDQGANWPRQPLHRDLRALRPLAGGRPVDIVEEIYARLDESLDYLVVREETCTPDTGTVRAIGRRGATRAEAFVQRRGDRVFYSYEGADLLDTDRLTPYETLSDAQRADHAALRTKCVEQPQPDAPQSWCSEDEWRRLTSYTTRPDSVVQLAHLYDTDRAGTINLFPRAGIGYNSVVPGRHAGETFHEKNAFAGVWGTPVAEASTTRPRSAVIGSVPAAVYEYLSGEAVAAGKDGWGYPSLELHFRD